MNKKKILIPIVSGVATLGILTGISYAYFSAKINEVNKTETIMKSNELGLTFTGVSEINASSMIPGDSFTKTFSVENTSNRAVTYNIYMQNITNEFNEDLVYTLSDEDGEVVSEVALPVTSTEKTYLKTNIEIESGVIKNYTLKIEYKYLDTPQNDYQGKTFNAILGIDTNETSIRKSTKVLAKVSSVTDDKSSTGTIKVVNNTNETQTYDLMLSDLVDIDELSTGYVYSVSKNEEEVITNEELPTTDQVILENQTIESGKIDNYTTSIEIPGVNLYNMIKENSSNETIDFSVRSGTSGTNGIYSTTATEGNKEVYYYRGNVDNNIIFNDMCWKIVRTTETRGVKLIYNGKPTDGQCLATGTATQIGISSFNPSYTGNAYVGYMYGTPGASSYSETHTNTNESKMKKYIDTWFNNNFDNETTSILEDTIFCNDRSTTTGTNNNTFGSSYGSLGYGTKATAYGVNARASEYTIIPNPTLVCPQDNDKFTVSTANGNGALKYPVGLITSDEAVFAGFNTKSSNNSDYKDTNNYLYTNSNYWALTPVYVNTSGAAGVTIVSSVGSVGSHYVTGNGTDGVRPVISLADGTLVKSTGDGTSTNPYVVK